MKIRTIMNVELSSICNNKCEYCPAPIQGKYRPTGFMTMETFEEVIGWIIRLDRQGTQREVNFFGVGEPLLNPQFMEMMEYACDKLPTYIRKHVNTNGNLLTSDIAKRLYQIGIREVDVTGHDPRITARAVRILQDADINYKVSFDFIMAPNNWAGQVDWFEPRYPKPYPCPWIHNGQVMIMSDGNITRCCIDAFGTGIFANLSMDIDQIEVTPFALCEKCHHTI